MCLTILGEWKLFDSLKDTMLVCLHNMYKGLNYEYHYRKNQCKLIYTNEMYVKLEIIF